MKKITAMLLALVLLALPVLGMAASPSELLEEAVNAGRPVTGKIVLDFGSFPGLDEETATIVNDLVDALGFTFGQAGDQTNFALTLSGVDALTFACANDGTDTYIKSNLLGEKPLAFNETEGKTVLDYLMNLAVASGAISEAEVAEVKAQIETALAQANTQLAEIDLDSIDLSGVIVAASQLLAKVETAEVTQQPKNCDTAATVATLTLTGEDVAALYKAFFEVLKNVPQFVTALNSMDSLTFNGETVTVEEMLEKLPEAADQMGAMIQGDIPVEIYMDEAGEPVYVTASVTMKAQNDEGVEETIAMEMNYARLTVNEGVTHAANVIAKDAANAGVSISVNVLDNEKLSTVNVGIASIADGVAQPVATVDVKTEMEYGETESEEDAEIAVTIIDSDSGEEISFRMEIESEAKKVGEDVAYECDIDLYILGLEEELLCIKAYEETGSAAETIIVTDVVRPGQMTEEEFNTFVNEDVLTAAQTALMAALQNLPMSVLSLMFQAE